MPTVSACARPSLVDLALGLGLDENYPAPNKIGYPSQQRVRELFAINHAMGGNTVRAQSLGFSFGSNWTMEPALDQFNEEAFRVADCALLASGPGCSELSQTLSMLLASMASD